MNEDKFLSLLGFAQKSGNVITGEDACTLGIKKRKIKLFIIANNSSENTKDRFSHLCQKYKIPYFIEFPKEQLSYAIGKNNRALYGITNKGFATKMMENLTKIGK